ncbi:DUF3833 domain-containing protein [Microbulbifer hainanensis]|uniref:DUF3833 domain-containing protein n=1 Tax=Microbulbifer hainanensis TaxID=2735675 RepID=UPI0018678FE7|nr:DUF3833 domain-containing protein [Microbulbifer hainanensis]
MRYITGARTLVFGLLTLLFAACSSPGIEHYRDRTPMLVPEDFFNGPLTAHGIIKNRSGAVTRTFNAELVGEWENGQGLLAEHFVFNDGETQLRDWRLIPIIENGAPAVKSYIATAGDVIGDAKVHVSGNAMFIRYRLSVPYNGKTIEVSVDDRMYLVSDHVLINQSQLSKWGLNVGEIVLTIIKQDDR